MLSQITWVCLPSVALYFSRFLAQMVIVNEVLLDYSAENVADNRRCGVPMMGMSGLAL